MTYTVRVLDKSEADAGEVRGVSRAAGVAMVAGKAARWEPPLAAQDAAAAGGAGDDGSGSEAETAPTVSSSITSAKPGKGAKPSSGTH